MLIPHSGVVTRRQIVAASQGLTSAIRRKDPAKQPNVGNNPLGFTDPWGLVTPWQVGWEWLTGTGPRQRNLYAGDSFLEELRRHEHIRNLLHDIADCNAPLKGERPYDLSGFQGVPKYINDYSTLGTFGLTGNLAVTYLGSYDLDYETVTFDAVGHTVTVWIHVWNSSTISSAIRPPVIGYTRWWKDNIGRPLDELFSDGPISKTQQNFYWNETVELKCDCKKTVTGRR